MSYYRYHRTINQAAGEILHAESARALRRQIAVETSVIILLSVLLVIGLGVRLAGLSSGLPLEIHHLYRAPADFKASISAFLP